jgi:hypothetical protein
MMRIHVMGAGGRSTSGDGASVNAAATVMSLVRTRRNIRQNALQSHLHEMDVISLRLGLDAGCKAKLLNIGREHLRADRPFASVPTNDCIDIECVLELDLPPSRFQEFSHYHRHTSDPGWGWTAPLWPSILQVPPGSSHWTLISGRRVAIPPSHIIEVTEDELAAVLRNGGKRVD